MQLLQHHGLNVPCHLHSRHCLRVNGLWLLVRPEGPTANVSGNLTLDDSEHPVTEHTTNPEQLGLPFCSRLRLAISCG